MKEYNLTDKEKDILWEWHVKDFIEFLESIGDVTRYVMGVDGELRFCIEELIKAYYVWQQQYVIKDDIDNERWVLMDRISRLPIAYASYKGKDKIVVRDYRLKRWLNDLNERIIELE